MYTINTNLFLEIIKILPYEFNKWINDKYYKQNIKLYNNFKSLNNNRLV